jgi:hypothetical protein
MRILNKNHQGPPYALAIYNRGKKLPPLIAAKCGGKKKISLPQLNFIKTKGKPNAK